MEIFNNVYSPFADFVHKLSLFNKKLLSFDKLKKSFDNYKDSLSILNFNSNILNTIVLEKKGNIYSLHINNNPKTLKQLTILLDNIVYGNVLSYLKELGGFPNEIIENPVVKNFEENNYPGFNLITNIKSRIHITNDLYKVLGNIDFKNKEIFINVLNNNPWLKLVFDNFLINLKEVYSLNNDLLLGDLVKTSPPKNNDIYTLFEAIKKHQKQIKGCWAIKYTGQRCLVDNLSCRYMKKHSDICKHNFDCPSRGCGCKNTKNCSKLCSNLNTPVPSDTILICVKGTFWLAAQDYMNTLILIPQNLPPSPVIPPAVVIEEDSNDYPVDPNENPRPEEEPNVIDIPIISYPFVKSPIFWIIFAILILLLIYLVYLNMY